MGPPCTGKSTVLNILKDLLDGMIVNKSTYQRPSIIFSSTIVYPEFDTGALAKWPQIYKSKLEGAM
jgi:aminoglycoside N3'-acetyltransferase